MARRGLSFGRIEAAMIHRAFLALLAVAGLAIAGWAEEAPANPPAEAPGSAVSPERAALGAFLQSHCLECHDKATSKGGLALDVIAQQEPAENAEAWEKVLRKLSTRQMPPPDQPRPEEQEYNAIAAWLAG